MVFIWLHQNRIILLIVIVFLPALRNARLKPLQSLRTEGHLLVKEAWQTADRIWSLGSIFPKKERFYLFLSIATICL